MGHAERILGVTQALSRPETVVAVADLPRRAIPGKTCRPGLEGCHEIGQDRAHRRSVDRDVVNNDDQDRQSCRVDSRLFGEHTHTERNISFEIERHSHECRSARTDIADVYRSEIECNRVHFKLLRTEFARNTDSSQYGMVIDDVAEGAAQDRTIDVV